MWKFNKNTVMNPKFMALTMSVIMFSGCSTFKPVAVPKIKNNSTGHIEHTVELEPGEGTILFVGNNQNAIKVRKDYFSSDPVKPEGILDTLLMGFYTGAPYGSCPAWYTWDYIDRMLAFYKQCGATVIIAYHGNITGGKDSNGSKFAKLAAAHGLKVMLQPNDFYFRGNHYWNSPAFRKANKQWKDSADYCDRYLTPRLKKIAPKFKGIENIYAWGPVEELPPEDEGVYTRYKQEFKNQFPDTLLYQIDSQQSSLKRLGHKQKPYPDIMGFDRYPWWTRIPGGKFTLWTPDYAARWLYNVIEFYPKAAYDLYKAPAIFVMQGCAEISWFDKETVKKKGWKLKAEKDFHPPAAPNVGWDPDVGKFYDWHRYLAPTNAWRLQNWLGICSGFKGLMLWSAGPYESHLAEALKKGKNTRVCLINEKLEGLPYLDEISRSWSEIRTFEPLLLNLHPENDILKFNIDDKNVYAKTHVDRFGNTFIIVVNGSIIRWDKNNPQILDYPKTKLNIRNGEMVNYIPLKGKRKIKIRLEKPDFELYDLRTFRE